MKGVVLAKRVKMLYRVVVCYILPLLGTKSGAFFQTFRLKMSSFSFFTFSQEDTL